MTLFLGRLLARIMGRHCAATGHNWFLYYRGAERWWNLRLWCGDPNSVFVRGAHTWTP